VALWRRLGVAAVWSALIGPLMTIGARLVGSPPSDTPWIALLGGIGAAICVFLFAGRT